MDNPEVPCSMPLKDLRLVYTVLRDPQLGHLFLKTTEASYEVSRRSGPFCLKLETLKLFVVEL